MARLILDTGVLIAAVRAQRNEAVFESGDDIAIPAVVIAEYLSGTLMGTDPGRAAAQRAFLDDVLDVITVIEYDTGIAEHHAHLLAYSRKQGLTRGAHDLVIAATARATGRTLITTDARAGFAELPGVEAHLLQS